MLRQIILDTETTGLDPKIGHRVIEIGCIELVNRKFTGEQFHIYLNPDRDSDEGALEVHGLTTEFRDDRCSTVFRYNSNRLSIDACDDRCSIDFQLAFYRLSLKFRQDLNNVWRRSMFNTCSIEIR